MKRIKPTKKVLIKRTRPKLNEYDYTLVDSDKFNQLLTAHIRTPDLGTIFSKPSLFAKLEYRFKNFIKGGIARQIFLLILGSILTLMTQYIYENWIKKDSSFQTNRYKTQNSNVETR